MFARLSILEEGDDRGPMAIERPAERVSPGIIRLVRIGAAREQGANHLDLAILRRDHQRGHPVLIFGVELRADIEQKLGHFDMVVIGGIDERRIAEIVARIDPATSLDEDRSNLEITVDRRGMEAGALAVLLGLIDAVAARQEGTDLVDVVGLGGARDIIVIIAERVERRTDVGVSARRRRGRRQQREAGNSPETHRHEVLLALDRSSRPVSQSIAPSTVSTERPRSMAGRRTMITGRLNSRAATSFASVAAPPLALQISTSIAFICSKWRSSVRANGPRPSTTS